MSGHPAHVVSPEGFTDRVARAALAAVPLVVGLGVVAMIVSPEVFAETESATGETPWGGAIFGLATFLAFTALPLGLFSWALRAGRRRGLVLTAIGAPFLALAFGVIPLAGALIGGWEGVSPLAVLVGAGCAVLNGFVLAAALRQLNVASGDG